MKFQLQPEDHQRISNLCGPTNSTLKQIEKELKIKIINRGSQFKIEGDIRKAELAKDIILKIYGDLEKDKVIEPSDIHLYLMNGINNLKKGKENSVSEISIHTPNVDISPNHGNQEAYVSTIKSKVLTFGIGPAGTGKTYLAVAAAVDALLNEKVDRIILIRPAVEAGEKLGFLPGDLSQKVDPYLRPLYDALYDMLGTEKTEKLIANGIVEIAPLAYMRGRTLNNSFIIVDESQNTTKEQMKMVLTRMGFGSSLVINGDLTQIDLPKNIKSGLSHAIEVVQGTEGIGFTTFSSADVVRHPLVKKIIDAYKIFEEKLGK